MQVHSFKPVINADSKILILGSMPGRESLHKGEYYGHPRNAFWRIMFCLLGEEPTEDYAAKKRMLLVHGIALWDVIQSCERKGSLDSAIKNIVPNDFFSLYERYPNIQHVFFNGAKAQDSYRRNIGFDDNKSFARLPSTSPAHAVKFDKKLKAWREILK